MDYGRFATDETQMKDYTIFTETTADLDANIVATGAVKMIEMSMTVGDDASFYAANESDEEIKAYYAAMRAGKSVKTSRISPYVYDLNFAPAMESGDVIYLSFSSGMSPAYVSTGELADKYESVYPDTRLFTVDSRSGTGGMGIMLERMIRNKAAGMSAAENVADIEQFKKRVNMLAFVEDLNFLKRGGRISPTSAVIGAFLNIKPIIRITDEGKLEVFFKCKGEMKAVKFISDIFVEEFDPQSDAPVYILHADNEKAADVLAAKVREAFPSATVKNMLLSPVIGTHLGPGAVVICYVKK